MPLWICASAQKIWRWDNATIRSTMVGHSECKLLKKLLNQKLRNNSLCMELNNKRAPLERPQVQSILLVTSWTANDISYILAYLMDQNTLYSSLSVWDREI